MNNKKAPGITSFFEDTLGANLSNSRWSWGAFNPQTNQLFLRVWRDQLRKKDGVEFITLLGKKNWDGRSLGYPERQRHVEAIRNGAEGYGVLCTSAGINTPGKRLIKDFDQDYLLKCGKIIEGRTKVYAQIVDRVPVEKIARRKTAGSTLVPDIKSIISARVDATMKEILVNARLGQGAFRAQVLAYWDMQCCVTGTRTLDAIRASHIKPWRDSNDEERLDSKNGLPLVATLDALFDAGLITFSPDGRLLTSKLLSGKEKKLLKLNGLKLKRKPTKKTIDYLMYHHNMVYVDKDAQ